MRDQRAPLGIFAPARLEGRPNQGRPRDPFDAALPRSQSDDEVWTLPRAAAMCGGIWPPSFRGQRFIRPLIQCPEYVIVLPPIREDRCHT